MTTLPPVVQQYVVDLDCSKPREAARIIGNHLIALADALEPADVNEAEPGACFTAESTSSDGLNTYQVLIQRPGSLGFQVVEPETVRASGYEERDGWVRFWDVPGMGRVASFRADVVESVHLAR